MTRAPYDQASKALLREALSRIGRAHVQHEVPGEAQWVDVFFEPDGSAPLSGLLGRMALEPALFEAFHDAPQLDDVRSCLRKQLSVGHARSAQPLLWIVSGGRPSRVIEAFGLTPLAGWPVGVYGAVVGLGLRMVVVSELPEERDTLLVRLMGAGATLATAVRDARSLPRDGWEREAAHAAVVVLRSRVLDPGEEEVAMQVEETYGDWYRRVHGEARAAGLAEGRAERELRGRAEALADAVSKILTARFGPLPAPVIERIRASEVAELERLTDRALSVATLDAL